MFWTDIMEQHPTEFWLILGSAWIVFLVTGAALGDWWAQRRCGGAHTYRRDRNGRNVCTYCGKEAR